MMRVFGEVKEIQFTFGICFNCTYVIFLMLIILFSFEFTLCWNDTEGPYYKNIGFSVSLDYFSAHVNIVIIFKFPF